MKKIIPFISLLAIGTAMPVFANTDHDGAPHSWVNHFFHEADTNKDGFVDKKEFLAHAEKKFDLMDANHDGKISKQEAMAYETNEHAAMKRHHKHSTTSSNRPDDTSSDKDRPDTSEDAKTNSESSTNH